MSVVTLVWSRCVFTDASCTTPLTASSSSPSSMACRQMTSTTPETLTVRCFAGVCDAASRCQHCSFDAAAFESIIPLCKDSSASCSAGRSSTRSISESRARGGGGSATNNRRHHALIAPCMQVRSRPAVTRAEESDAQARRRRRWCLHHDRAFPCSKALTP